MKNLPVLCCFFLLAPLTACQKQSNDPVHQTASTSANATASMPPLISPITGSRPSSTETTSVTANQPLPKAIDWTVIDSGVKPVDKETFEYKFALDSAPVKAYMDAYKVDAKTARYNLTVGMAVNEVLDKVLDQIGTAYVSHELTAGNNSQFIIHTTPQIAPSQYQYVFNEPFAHGLSMPIVIINDGKKQPHADHPQ